MSERRTEVEKLDQAISYWLERLRTAVPAIVVKYNETTNMVTIKRTRRSKALDGRVYEEKPFTVPACWWSFGGWFIAGDLSPGDEGVLLVSDREIGEWLQRGGVVDPISTHRHAMHDGMFLPIVRNKKRPLPARGGNLVIGREDGSAQISIGSDGVLTVDAATRVKLGESASKAVARETDPVGIAAGMATWMSQVAGYINGLVPMTVNPAVPPTFATITSGSSLVKCED